MALLSRVYYNAVFGGLGGLLGWLLFGALGDKNPGDEQAAFNTLLGGALVGGLIGYLVVAVDALRDRSAVRFARLASYGVALACVGGALGMVLGDWANYLLVRLLGDHLAVTMLARGLGWSLLGVAIGASEGIAARSLGKLSYGTLGGLLGGFVGGGLFQLIYTAALRAGSTAAVGGAVGLVVLGACIGALSALVQAVFQPASVRVVRGWQEGREYPLDRPASLLGRDEHADIALFRDMRVEKRHAYIRQENGRYVLVNNGAPPEFTRVNDVPVADRQPLADGDRIQLGNVLLRFQLRAVAPGRAASRGRPRPAGAAL